MTAPPSAKVSTNKVSDPREHDKQYRHLFDQLKEAASQEVLKKFEIQEDTLARLTALRSVLAEKSVEMWAQNDEELKRCKDILTRIDKREKLTNLLDEPDFVLVQQATHSETRNILKVCAIDELKVRMAFQKIAKGGPDSLKAYDQIIFKHKDSILKS